METKEISKLINSSIKKAVNNALVSSEKNSEKCEKIHFARPNRVREYLEKNGFEDITDYSSSTNGWQWDYWMQFIKDDKVFSLTGDGFYKDYCEFSFDKERTNEHLLTKMDDALE